MIQRADELTEFVSLYWKDKRQPLSAQVKRGLALAFPKFSPYALAKYNRDDKIKLRDVLFLSHAKPKDEEQAAVWRKLVDGKLEAPDTWEVALSTGKDKLATWTRLLEEGSLGALALLRNLRNMEQAKVPRSLIQVALRKAKWKGILPWQFISAARAAPWAEAMLDEAMLKSLEGSPVLPDKTGLLIDVSGSMKDRLSGKSEAMRIDAACALAIRVREIAESAYVWTFSEALVEIAPRRGFALCESIVRSQPMSGTYLAKAIKALAQPLDRLIVITDEQAHDGLGTPPCDRAYLVNVGPYKPALQTDGKWTRINGWSERLVDWIREAEAQNLR